MFRRILAGMLCSVVGAMAAQAAVTTLHFQDEFGNPIVDTDILVAFQGQKQILPGNATGTFVLDIEEGDEVYFETINPDGTLGKSTSIVPDSSNDGGAVVTFLGGARNECEMPLEVGNNLSVTPFYTTGVGGSDDIIDCGTADFDPSWDTAWFTVIGTGAEMFASTCNSALFDTTIGVFCQDCEDMQCIAGRDDSFGCLGNTTLVKWDTQYGAEYRIAVSGWEGDSGGGLLTVGETHRDNRDAPFQCVATGGCCFDRMRSPSRDACEVLTEDSCDMAGGTYQGDGTDCTPDPTGETSDSIAEPGTAIPDRTSSFTTDTIEITESFVISDLNVDFATDHTWLGDLILEVIGPDGTKVVLVPRNSSDDLCSSEDGADIVFDDEAGAFTCGVEPVVGSGQPHEPLSAFDGKNAYGTWTFRIRDHVSGDVGDLVRWSLHFEKGTPPCAGACCTNGPGTASDCAMMTQAECGSGDGLFVGGSCDNVDQCEELLVEFESVTATQTAKGVTIQWVTSLELDTAGFRVLRQDDGRRKSLTHVANVSAAGYGTSGASYELIDDSKEAAHAQAYFIEEIDLFGKRDLHGPFLVVRQPQSRSRGAEVRKQDR